MALRKRFLEMQQAVSRDENLEHAKALLASLAEKYGTEHPVLALNRRLIDFLER